jgi:hypothetical protein
MLTHTSHCVEAETLQHEEMLAQAPLSAMAGCTVVGQLARCLTHFICCLHVLIGEAHLDYSRQPPGRSDGNAIVEAAEGPITILIEPSS